MTFVELEKQYQSYYQSLSDTLNKLGRICSDFVEENPEHFEDIEYVSNPYELGYNERYDQHWIDTKNNTITVNFSHQDPYDTICDSNSQIIYPLHWVEAVFERDDEVLEGVMVEVKDSIRQHHTHEEQRGRREAIYNALKYNLISKEVAQQKLAELG